MVLPSGLHAAERSKTPSVRVRLRGVPFSAGADQMSPRPTTATRLPLGEIDAPWMFSAASTMATRSVSRSPGTVIDTGRDAFVARSSTYIFSPCCSTISPGPSSSGPIAGHFTSCVVKRVTCSVLPESMSWLHTFSTCSSAALRSERK